MQEPASDLGYALNDIANFFSQNGAIDSSLFYSDNGYGNRVNSAGSKEEHTMQMAFCGTLLNRCYQPPSNDLLSYLGSANNPPDFIIKNGYAVEVKKTTSNSSEIQLNSSPIKREIVSENATARVAQVLHQEMRTSAPLLYCFVFVIESMITKIVFIEGALLDVANSADMFERARACVEQAFINTEYALRQSDEIARIQAITPLITTTLRVRPMWTITNPFSPSLGFVSNDCNALEIFAMVKPEYYVSWRYLNLFRAQNSPFYVQENMTWYSEPVVTLQYRRNYNAQQFLF